MRMGRVWAALCLAAFGLCLTVAAGEGKFKLGGFFQLTGGNSAFGIEARTASVLAIDESNAAGGFNGQQIDFIVYDTQGSAEEAVKVAAKLIEVDKVDACLGSINSSEVLAAARYFNDAKIPLFGMGTSPTWMAENWPYVFRAAVNNALSAPLIVNMAKTLGMTKLATFKGQDDSSLATANSFIKDAKSKGIEIVADESYDLGDTDFSPQIATIIHSEPHAVFLSVIGDTGPVVVKQLRQFGYTGIILYKESFMVAQIEVAGKAAANNILFANPYVTYTSLEECDIPIVLDFLKKYAAKHGGPCKTDSAYRGWDTMMVLKEAVKIAGKNDRESITAAVSKVNIPGLGGQLNFTRGSREGYGTEFNTFAFIDQKNILFSKWLAAGGYEAYKKATGNKH